MVDEPSQGIDYVGPILRSDCSPFDNGEDALHTVGKFFILQWKSIQDTKQESDGVVPILTRNMSCLKWISIFREFLETVIGARGIPLIYVLRTSPVVPPAMPLFNR